MNAEPVSAGRLIWLIAGFLVWSAAFVVLYSVLSIGCEFGWHEWPVLGPVTLQRVVLVALFLVSLAASWAVVQITGRRRRRSRRAAEGLQASLETIAWLAAWAALASTFFSLVPVFFLTACY